MGALRQARLRAPFVRHGSSSREPHRAKSVSQETVHRGSGITIVTDYVREKKRRSREVFIPLSHPPGHAQVDFGEAVGVIGGVECKLHYFVQPEQPSSH